MADGGGGGVHALQLVISCAYLNKTLIEMYYMLRLYLFNFIWNNFYLESMNSHKSIHIPQCNLHTQHIHPNFYPLPLVSVAKGKKKIAAALTT